MLGYMIPLFSIATYTTAGMGLSQAQGASIQAAMAAGQLVGRPALGLVLDFFAPITLVAAPSAFALDNYSQEVLHRTGVDVFKIGIGLAGGANIVAAIALFAAKKFERKDRD
ncbi:2088_t:CDS:2 [Acaulospora colombiana]|uniref:2088_t:CDS:1 n=1 Tax=Acaulospora colombiana TaxID=27376 RepID=A0ACA9N012_9GLOM|nr:2088_t:CDS:2 [Acaulospora colombiana]